MRFWLLLGALWVTTSQASESNKTYDTHCGLCHQKAGVGLAGQFPRLAGRASEFAKTDAGRRYLVEVILFGMAGKVEIDGAPIIGVMPPFATLSDEEVISVLNYIITLEASSAGAKKRSGAPTKIDGSIVRQVREGAPLSPTEVRDRRERVVKAR